MREVIETDRTIASVAASYDLAPRTVGNWVARLKKDHMSQADEKDVAESAEIRRLRAQLHELRHPTLPPATTPPPHPQTRRAHNTT